MKIQYACVCSSGLVRKSNQDNLVWERQCLPLDNDGLPAPVIGETDLNGSMLFGVFDGIGGEPRGDMAAYLSAKTAAECGPIGTREELAHLCHRANRAVCEFARRNKLSACGTTAAMLLLDRQRIIGCNVGDSRICLLRGGTLTRLSEDHVLPVYTRIKPPLLQYLGIPETEMIIEPYLFEEELRPDDLYVICSDGLTDMLGEEQIRHILLETPSIVQQAEALLAGALAAGGRDNITFILIRIPGSESRQ